MKKNITLKRFICLTLSLSVLSACTEPGDTTYIGSATGGVIGASLGAIIGNQTGDPGSGLAIGAVAGAGTGAAIGNALEAQQKSIRTQDEALERQQKILAAQNSEIQELRGSPSDSINSDRPARMGSDVRGSLSRDSSITERLNQDDSFAKSASTQSYDNMNVSRDRSQPVEIANSNSMNKGAALREADLGVSTASQSAQQNSYNQQANPAQNNTAKIANALSPDSDSTECQKATAESQKAESATEGADKLFYLRRAIRLCPSKAIYHKNLADQYLSLGRNEDAKAAYADAVRLDPSLKEASQAMSAISTNNIY